MLNKVILIGRVGSDIELKTIGNDTKVVNLTLATSESFKNKQGEKITNTEWHNLKSFGTLAGIFSQYVKKGDLIYVEGKITTETWEKEGIKHYKTVININELKMLGNKNSESTPEAKQNQPVQKYDEYTQPVKDDNTGLPF
jgi:single-strand DNA-binding protein